MPWESKTVEKLREAFVLEAQECTNFSSLCREFQITRRTGYKWLKRYEDRLGLKDQSKVPNTIANKTPLETEIKILELRKDNPGWGAKTIKTVLENQGHTDIPCVKTVNNILNRYCCISTEESQKRIPYKRFEKDKCNKMWQTDFKGEFYTNDGKKCYPLDIIDDHSRFSIKIAPFTSTENVVIPSFKAAFEEFGLPDSVLSDNGAQFKGFRQGLGRFEKWLMDLDILPIHCRMQHPQTQGKIERFHRTMKNELLKHNKFNDIKEVDQALQCWRNKYNTIRPHEALGMKTPADVYIPSSKTYSDKVKKYEYDGRYHIIRVNSWGYVRFAGYQVYLSETMIDEHLEFRPNPSGESFFVCYRNFKIAEFSTETGKLLNRKISRL